jgi:hypothetical protein
MSSWNDNLLMVAEIGQSEKFGAEQFRHSLLTEIEKRVAELDEQDIEGHIWWSIFQDMVKKIKA